MSDVDSKGLSSDLLEIVHGIYAGDCHWCGGPCRWEQSPFGGDTAGSPSDSYDYDLLAKVRAERRREG